jgi:hypothetical protein
MDGDVELESSGPTGSVFVWRVTRGAPQDPSAT